MPPERLLDRYRRDESGATALEYSLVASILMIALTGIFATGGATEALYDVLQSISEALAGAGGESGDES